MAGNRDIFETTIYVNSEQAKDALAQLTKKATEQEKAYKHLLETMGDTSKTEKARKAWEQTKKSIENTEKGTENYQRALKNLNGASIERLVSLKKQLNAEIKKLKPNTEEYLRLTKEYTRVEARLNSLKSGYQNVNKVVETSKFSLKGLVNGFNKYWGSILLVQQGLTGLSTTFRSAAEAAAKLDDAYADVMKTTNLTREEVKVLDAELMKIDTRTGREQLLMLARDAGKLGISGQENILGFVRAADKIQVALGEDLGEDAIKNLGKISDVLGYTDTMGIEKSLLSIGSAVNAVGQASTANEAYLVDFTQRMAGVAAQTNISAADIIGFASGLDQSAMKVEMASTAFQKFVMKIYEDPTKFASYAGMEVSKFSELLATDANGAIITVLKSLKDKGGFASLVPIFQDMGLDGARAVSVLAAMASNLGAITDAQALANIEFSKATSIENEYNIKNENLQAQLEKARKEFHNATITLGQSLNPVMLKSTKLVTYLVKALAAYGKEIKTIIIVALSLTVALKAQALIQGIVTTARATARMVSLALAAAEALLTGNITRATAAWTMMNTAMKASVFGLVVAGVSEIVIAIQHWTSRMSDAEKASKALRDAQVDAQKSIQREKIDMETLRDIINDNTLSIHDRRKALLELQKIVPDYHASITDEGVLINNNTEALDAYIKRLLQMAMIDKYKDKIAELGMEINELTDQQNNPKANFWDYLFHGVDAKLNAQNRATKKTRTNMEAVKKMEEELKKLTKSNVDAVINQMNVGNDGTGGEDGNGDGNGGKGKNSTINKATDPLKEHLTQIREVYAELKEIIDFEDESLESYYTKINENNKKNTEKKLTEQEEIQKQEEENAKRKLEFEKWIQTQLSDFRQQNIEISAKEEYEEQMKCLEKFHRDGLISEEEYQSMKHKIDLDWLGKRAETAEKLATQASASVRSLQDAELENAEANYQQEIKSAGNNADQKEQIEARYEAQKLEIQKKYADAQMVMDIAKATASGAVAAIKAYAEGGPFAGPALAAMISVATLAEIATIIAQRNAIKNATVSLSTSSNSSTSTSETTDDNFEGIGSRVISGYATGGPTRRSLSDSTAVGIVHANEWVAPAWMIRKNPVVFANLEQYRRSNSNERNNARSRSFATGGYTPSGNMYEGEIITVLKELKRSNDELSRQLSQGIHSDVVLTEIERKQKMMNQFKQKTSL